MEKIKVALLFGGCSSEYSVSLQSAHSVLQHMDPEKYEPILIGISETGDWYRFTGDPANIAADTWLNEEDCVPAVISPDRSTHGLVEFRKDGVRTTRIDVGFPMLHGQNGEDGTVQGLLELAGIPIVGCKVLSSALCMDKERANLLVELAGIPIPQTLVFNKGVTAEAILEAVDAIGYPVFVKPVKAGSSYGVTSVATAAELPAAVTEALRYDDRVMIQETIVGIEIGCAIMGDEELVIGAVDEVELSQGFFDFKEKYTHHSSAIHVQARISPEKAEEVAELSARIYKALDCSGMARVDVFLTPDGEVVFNEVNTIPGFTPMSRYPGMMAAAGISYDELVDRLIGLALPADVE